MDSTACRQEGGLDICRRERGFKRFPTRKAQTHMVSKADERSSTEYVEDVALIFEGGAMRNAYTAAVVRTLVEEGIVFPKAYGTSAGAALAVFYATRDPERARATFTDAVKVKGAGGAAGLLEGRGFFNLQLMFEGLAETNAIDDDEWTVHFDQLRTGPTDVHIEAFDMGSGKTKAWTRADMRTLTDCMMRVEASCAYPLFTDSIEIDGRRYIDGGMGESHDICLDAAMKDGFERFFIVRTQPRDYRMKPMDVAHREAYKIAYRDHKAVFEAMEARPREYNALLDRIYRLEDEGAAYVFCPDTMPITFKTIDYEKLCNAYDLGMAQSRRELPEWRSWLGV